MQHSLLVRDHINLASYSLHELYIAVLRGRRHTESAVAAPAGAAGDVPEVADGLPREEAPPLPALLLRVGPGAAGDPRPGVRLTHHPGQYWLHSASWKRTTDLLAKQTLLPGGQLFSITLSLRTRF